MKKLFLSLLGTALCLPAFSQELPQPSPSSMVSQRVGLTDITVKYSRPSRKDRKIFGELVPAGKLWRTGANANTTIEFSSEVMIDGETLAAGIYSIFTIPNMEEWIVIFNKNSELSGTNGYSEEEDAMRITVPVKKSNIVETFTIGFNNVTGVSTDLMLGWENQMVNVPIKVNSMELAMENIKVALEKTEKDKLWGVYRNSANFYLQNNMLPEAEKMIAKSIELKNDSWYSYWVQGQILAANGKNKEAVKSGEMAIKTGKKASGDDFGYTEMINKDIAAWKMAMVKKK